MSLDQTIPFATMKAVNAGITPGPWVLDNPKNAHVTDEIYHTVEAGEGFHPEGFYLSGCMSVEDARLIAAAPDMLAALQAIDADWASSFPGGPDGDRDWNGLGKLSDETVETWRTIRAAIAKATTPAEAI